MYRTLYLPLFSSYIVPPNFQFRKLVDTCIIVYIKVCSIASLYDGLHLLLVGNPPQISASPSLHDKYSPRNDHQLMTLSTTRDYYLKFVSSTHGYSKEKPRYIHYRQVAATRFCPVSHYFVSHPVLFY